MFFAMLIWDPTTNVISANILAIQFCRDSLETISFVAYLISHTFLDCVLAFKEDDCVVLFIVGGGGGGGGGGRRLLHRTQNMERPSWVDTIKLYEASYSLINLT